MTRVHRDKSSGSRYHQTCRYKSGLSTHTALAKQKEIKGSGLFSSIGRFFKKAGKAVYKGVKKVAKGTLNAAKTVADVGGKALGAVKSIPVVGELVDTIPIVSVAEKGLGQLQKGINLVEDAASLTGDVVGKVGKVINSGRKTTKQAKSAAKKANTVRKRGAKANARKAKVDLSKWLKTNEKQARAAANLAVPMLTRQVASPKPKRKQRVSARSQIDGSGVMPAVGGGRFDFSHYL